MFYFCCCKDLRCSYLVGRGVGLNCSKQQGQQIVLVINGITDQICLANSHFFNFKFYTKQHSTAELIFNKPPSSIFSLWQLCLFCMLCEFEVYCISTYETSKYAYELRILNTGGYIKPFCSCNE